MGRVRNMMTLPGGEMIWPPLAIPSLAQRFPFCQVQFVQPSVDRLQAKLVVREPWSAETEADFATEVCRRLGHDFSLSISYVDEIPLPSSGKYEDFRSEIGG